MENEKIETVVARHDEQLKQHDKDICKLQDQAEAINRLATSVELLAKESTHTNEKLENMGRKIDKTNEKVDKLDSAVEDIKNRPEEEDSKKWKNLKKQVFTAIVTAIIALVLAKVGLI